MIKGIFDFVDGFTTTIFTQVQQVIRKEIEYNMQVFQEGIQEGVFRAVEKSIDYVKKELTYLVIMLSAFLLGMLFITYGASVFLDTVFFNNEGVGFILVGAFLLFIALMFRIIRRR